MVQKRMEVNSIASEVAEAPSREFVRAVAQLLETDPEDILSELGYTYPEEEGIPLNEYETGERAG